MKTPDDNVEAANRFGVIARNFCSVVDSASSMDRTELLGRIYRILPKLIDEAISLPDVELRDSDGQIEGTCTPAGSHIIPRQKELEDWDRLYKSLKDKLGDWDLYHQVFDPTEDNEAIFGTLADDIADIYRDLKKGLNLDEMPQPRPEDFIGEWRLLFYSHWGKHAMDALLTIHFRLQSTAS